MITFESQRACSETVPPWVENPYRLISLGEIMEQSDARYLLALGEHFAYVHSVIATMGDLPKERREGLRSNVYNLRGYCESLGLTMTVKSIDRLLEGLKAEPPVSGEELQRRLDDLSERLSDEFASILFLSVRPELAAYYDKVNLFGDSVAANFPSAAFDIEEAGKCLALGRGTACVFHLMRVLEVGLYAMAKQFNVTPEENWHNAIEQIQSEVNRLAKTSTGSKSPWKKAWKDRVEFYSEAAVQFMYIKEAWRNRGAHAGKVYTLEKARSIFNHVCELMKHLATRLAE